jgi:sulfate permease, SulP family
MIAIIEAKRAGLLAPKYWASNIVAGVIVGVVALPLAMAFAIASGAKPEQGLYTAIVAGLLTSLFGGSRLQIAGPTGAFIVILSGITTQYGIAGLQIATLMAGVMLIAMGLLKLGSVIKFIPGPVIVGFTTGIGVIIWVGQWKDFFGLQPTGVSEHFLDKLWQLITAFPTLHVATTGLALLSLTILIACPKFFKRVPAPLIALIVATAVQSYFKFDGVATIGSAFGGIPQVLPSFSMPSISYADVIKLIGPAFTIALLGAIESLLSAVVADGMSGTRHDSNQELVGQGVANIFSPLFGGFASTGAIARTATNIRNGGTSPIAGIVHVITLVLIILLLAPLASYIPLGVLAAVLFVVAYNMSDMAHFWRLARTAPKPDVAILLITFLLTVFADLVVAVNTGVMLAALLFMRRMAKTVLVEMEPNEKAIEPIDGATEPTAPALPPNMLMYSIDGPFFFGAASKLEHILESIQQRMDTVVLRMGRVPFVDSTGIEALEALHHEFNKRNVRLVICEIRDNVAVKLKRAGFLQRVGEANIFATREAFLASLVVPLTVSSPP